MPRKVGHALGYNDDYDDGCDDYYDDYDDSEDAHRSNHDMKGNSRLFICLQIILCYICSLYILSEGKETTNFRLNEKMAHQSGVAGVLRGGCPW